MRALKTFIENALLIITNVSSIYITYIFFSALCNYICHANLSTTVSDLFEDQDLQTLWTEREDILKWCSILCYFIFLGEMSDGTEYLNVVGKDPTRRKDFPTTAWGVHFEAAMYVRGYLAGLCVLRLVYDLFMILRMTVGVIGICGIVGFLARKSGRGDQEERELGSSNLSPETRLNEVSCDESDGDSEVWSSDGIPTPPSTPDAAAYGEDFEYEDWDCWAG